MLFATGSKSSGLGGKWRDGLLSVVLAGGLGVVTRFRSCSAVPLFIGFVEAGVPLGVTFTSLIASPMINEVALILLVGLFGFRIGLIYVATGLAIAIAAGWVIGKLRMEKYIEGWVSEIQMAQASAAAPNMTCLECHVCICGGQQ